MNRPASSVTLGEVVRALGSVQMGKNICHVFTGKEAACVHFRDCGIRSVWSGLMASIQSFMDQTTLDHILEDEYAVSERLTKRLP